MQTRFTWSLSGVYSSIYSICKGSLGAMLLPETGKVLVNKVMNI